MLKNLEQLSSATSRAVEREEFPGIPFEMAMEFLLSDGSCALRMSYRRRSLAFSLDGTFLSPIQIQVTVSPSSSPTAQLAR